MSLLFWNAKGCYKPPSTITWLAYSRAKKKTYQAYSLALRYLIEAVGNKELSMITRHDLLAFRVYLREGKEQEPRREYNKFEGVMTFLKRRGRVLLIDRENSWINLPRRHAIR
jgi:hypothetical protein